MNYFTTKRALFLVPSNKCYEEFEKIDRFLEILEISQVSKIINNIYKNDKTTTVGRKGYNPFNMFATIIYCFSKFKSSVRELESLCIFDLRVNYIMEQKAPSYKTFSEFINTYIVPYQYEIFSMITKTVIKEFNVDISDQYVDGTKLEANANKYKFVWKTTAFHKRLDSKIKELLLEMGFEITERNFIKSCKLNELINKYISKEEINVYSIPSGRGKRLTKEQKSTNWLINI